MNVKSLFLSGLAIASALTFSGCATITRGTTQSLVIESDPPGADVELSNGLRGRTPASFIVKRRENLVVKIKKEGYETVEANVTSSVRDGGGTAMAGNILFGGLIGAAIDGGNGSNKALSPNPVSVKLFPIPQTSPIQQAQVTPPVKGEPLSQSDQPKKTKRKKK
jgi:hypothetical protein